VFHRDIHGDFQEDEASMRPVPSRVLLEPRETDTFEAAVLEILPVGLFIEALPQQLSYADLVRVTFLSGEKPFISFEGQVVTAVRGRGVRIETTPSTSDEVLWLLATWSKERSLDRMSSPDPRASSPQNPSVPAPSSPRRTPLGASPRPSLHSSPKLRTREPRVLVIDSNPTTLDALVRALHTKGCRVLSVVEPERAMQILENGAFDAVFLDALVPSLAGAHLLGEIRKNQNETPVAIISHSEGWDSSSQNLIDAGASVVMHKPFAVDDLLCWLDSVLWVS
jgi:CheY-like chemotaxis protein